jgi:hypothetical protein
MNQRHLLMHYYRLIVLVTKNDKFPFVYTNDFTCFQLFLLFSGRPFIWGDRKREAIPPFETLWTSMTRNKLRAAYIPNKIFGIFLKNFPFNYFFVIFSLAYVIENNNKITNKKKGVCNCHILNGLIISDGKYIGAGFACCVCIVFA